MTGKSGKTGKIPGNKRRSSKKSARIRLLDKNANLIEGPDKILLAVEFVKAGDLVVVCAGDDCAVLCNAHNTKALSRLAKSKPIFCAPPFLAAGNENAAERLFGLSSEEKSVMNLHDRPAVYLRLGSREAGELACLSEYGEIPVSFPREGILRAMLDAGPEMLAVACIHKNEMIIGGGKDFPGLDGELADYVLFDKSEKIFYCPGRRVRIISGLPVTVRTGDEKEENPLKLSGGLSSGPDVLALGGSCDNTVSVAKGSDIFLSRVSGNLRNPSSSDTFERAIARLKQISGASPEIVAHDPDPDCLAARFAGNIEGASLLPIQHHFAHIASCMAENGETGRVLGVVYDHGGFGEDGNRWGTEFLAATPRGYDRLGHLRNARLPGAGSVPEAPWRVALTYINMAYGYNTVSIVRELFKSVAPEKIETASKMLDSSFSACYSSCMGDFIMAMAAMILTSAGRPFADNPVAALENVMYEMALEDQPEPYPFEILDDGNLLLVDPAQIIYDAVENILAMKPPSLVSCKMFESIAHFTAQACDQLRERARTDTVVLTGGLFENRHLAQRVAELLEKSGFRILVHREVPPGDAGVSAGQAFIARARQTAGDER